MREQARQHRRHQRHAGNVPAVERIAHRLCVESRLQANRAAEQHAAHQDRQATDVEQRHAGKPALADDRAEPIFGGDRTGLEIAPAEAGALGAAGGAGREQDRQRRVVGDRRAVADVELVRLGQRRARRCRGHLQPGNDRSQLRESPIAGRAQQQAGPRIRKLLRQLTRREPQVERQRRTSREHGPEEPGRELACILQQQRDRRGAARRPAADRQQHAAHARRGRETSRSRQSSRAPAHRESPPHAVRSAAPRLTARSPGPAQRRQPRIHRCTTQARQRRPQTIRRCTARARRPHRPTPPRSATHGGHRLRSRTYG